MCMRFGFNPAIHFCHFSTLLTLSVCAGATSTPPKFYLFFIVAAEQKRSPRAIPYGSKIVQNIVRARTAYLTITQGFCT